MGGAARQWPSPREGTVISIASAPLGAALPRNPSRGRPRSAGAAEWACGSRPLPSRVRPPLSLLLQLLLPPRPGLRRPPPSATPAVNERPAPPGAGCRRRGLPGGTRPAKMYGKEGSASGLANLQNADLCPPAGPRRGQGRGLGARLGSFCRSVCASVLGGQRCSGPGTVGSSRSFGPRSFEGAGAGGRWSVGVQWARGIRSGWVLGKASLPWSRADRGCCDSICRINKSRLCWGVLCGKPVRDCGETLAACLVPAPSMWEAAPAVQRAGQRASSGSQVSPPLDGPALCLPLPPVGPKLPNFQICPPQGRTGETLLRVPGSSEWPPLAVP